jgi:drug/metabolite transporter (DMT)-like permease
VYALLLGGICIGFAPVLVRLSDVGPVASAFWRMCLAAPLLWVMWAAAAARTRLALAAAGTRALAADADDSIASANNSRTFLTTAALLAGLFFAADLGTWHFSIRRTTVANATLLANCAPVLVTLYALLIEKRRPPALYYLALLLAMLGAFTLVGPSFGGSGEQWRGDALALVAAVFYTAYMLAVRRARQQHDTLQLMAVSTTITAIVLLPVALAFNAWAGQPFWPSSANGWWVIVLLAVVTQVAGQGLIAYALAHLSVALSTTGLLIQPVVSAAAAWLLFGEALRPLQWLGGLVLMTGIALARRSEPE